MSDSYSQYGEDRVVAELLGDATGRLLEIGAWDPKTFSNSRLLIERGWRAVLVEFSPAPVRALVSEYGSSESVQVLQAAISIGDHGALREFDLTDDGLSTRDPATLEKWRDRGGYFGKLWVPQISLERLLFQFGGDFAFVSVDTEGTSVDLAVHYLIDLQQLPRVMCVEHDGRAIELMAVAQTRGYRMVHANGTNIIIARGDECG